MSINYKKIEFTLHELLVEIDKAYRLLEFEANLLEKIQAHMNLIKTKRYSVAVVGEFKRGKSTLINALLGSKILPADVTPTTATINRITFAPSPKAVITYKDATTEEIGINDLCDYVTKLTSDGEHRALKVKEATIYYPTQICQNFVDIIDTPGLNDEDRMTKITIDMLENVDAAIVPIHARAPFSATEKNFVCLLLESSHIHDIVFVLTYMDTLDEDDYELDSFLNSITMRIKEEVFSELESRQAEEHVLAKAHAILDNMRLFPVSSALALQSFITNNRKDLKASGFDEFNKSLLHIITAKQLENAVQKCVTGIHALLSEMELQNKNRISCINNELEQLETMKQTVTAYSADVKKTLNTVFAVGYERIEKCINSLHALKNQAISLFIKALSEIRVNDSDTIRAALSKAGAAAYDLINKQGILSVSQQLLQLMREDIVTFSSQRQSVLARMPDVKVTDVVNDMLTFAENRLQSLKFKWKLSPVPDVSDLASCNVIETAVDAIDLSVGECVKELNAAMTDIRKNWFAIAEEDASMLAETTLHEYNINHVILDRRLKAQIHNFQVLEADSEKIIARCDRLQEEVFGATDKS